MIFCPLEGAVGAELVGNGKQLPRIEQLSRIGSQVIHNHDLPQQGAGLLL